MIEKKIIIGEGGLYPLNGILTLPDGCSPEKPVPAVVLVHGSGSSNMDEKTAETKHKIPGSRAEVPV